MTGDVNPYDIGSGEEALRAAIRRFRHHPDEAPLRVRLANALTDRCCTDDIAQLAFLLGLDYDLLPGDNKRAKARALVLHFERRDALDAVISALSQARPDIEL